MKQINIRAQINEIKNKNNKVNKRVSCLKKINKIEYLARLKNKENTQIINVRNKLVYYRCCRHQKANKGKLQTALHLHI